MKVTYQLLVLCIFGMSCASSGNNNGAGPDAETDVDSGSIEVDANTSTTGGVDAAPCVATSVQAEESVAPVDIIWVVDSSGSMGDEEDAVQNTLNDFSAYIAASGLDYRVILIGDQSEMSVPPPLGGSVNFLHVNENIGSTNSLEKLISTYPQYKDFLRPGARVHFVEVSDDDSSMSYGEFNQELAGLSDPGIPVDYTFHAICSDEQIIFTPPPPLPPIMGPCTGGLGQGGADEVGATYLEMVAATGGVWRSICETDWEAIFSAVAEAVAVQTPLPCTFDLPEPPDSQILNQDQVNVVYTSSSGNESIIPRVMGFNSCNGSGWYYDSLINPEKVIMCPDTCNLFEADTSGTVKIEFGCDTIIN